MDSSKERGPTVLVSVVKVGFEKKQQHVIVQLNYNFIRFDFEIKFVRDEESKRSE